jgi:hypothetical protein
VVWGGRAEAEKAAQNADQIRHIHDNLFNIALKEFSNTHKTKELETLESEKRQSHL